MALIFKRNGVFLLGYCIRENEQAIPKLEAFVLGDEARSREKEILKKDCSPDFTKETKIKNYIDFFMKIFAAKIWSIKSYENALRLTQQFIYPLIKDDNLNQIDEDYIQALVIKLKEVSVITNDKKKKPLANGTIEKIICNLRTMFEPATYTNLYTYNPFSISLHLCDDEKTNECEYEKWDDKKVINYLEECEKTKLFIFMHLSFGCHMAAKEILALSWNDVSITDDLFTKNKCYLIPNKILERTRLSILKRLKENEQPLRIFAAVKSESAPTRLMFFSKKDGMEKIMIPHPVAKILRDWKRVQKEYLFGLEKFENNDLVISLASGKPCEYRVIEKEFVQLRTRLENPTLRLGQLRVYSLKRQFINSKITKSAETNAIQKVYEHLLDEDYLLKRTITYRDIKMVAIKSKAPVDLRNVKPPERNEEFDLYEIMESIKSNPEFASKLADLLNV